MTSDPKHLEQKARSIRSLTLSSIYKANSGHIGSAFSMVEILTALLFSQMNWLSFLSKVHNMAPKEQLAYFHHPELKRDRLVISKGHGVPAWYAALADAGFIQEEELYTLRVLGSRLQGHPERCKFPFVDATTGSLAQGQSEALGYALAKKIQKRSERVYCVIGDGESNEGQVWETALSAPKFKLDNLVIIVDYNKKQNEGSGTDIMDLEQLDKKWEAFNWHVQRVNGHDFSALLEAFENTLRIKEKPHIIIADTQKGYLGDGRLFMNGGHNPAIDEASYREALEFLQVPASASK